MLQAKHLDLAIPASVEGAVSTLGRRVSDLGRRGLPTAVARDYCRPVAVESNVAAIRDFIERGWNAGDESVFEEHLAADFAHPGGRDGFKRMVLGFRAAFPDLALEVHDIFGSEDKVVTRFTMRGTHEGEILGVAPTGRQVEFAGIAIDVMRDGQRVGGWAQLDRLGLLVGLGAVDPAAFR